MLNPSKIRGLQHPRRPQSRLQLLKFSGGPFFLALLATAAFAFLQTCPLPRLGGRTPPSESENGLHETVGEMRVNKQHLKAPRKQQASGAFSPHKVQSLSSRLGVPSFNHKNAQSRTMTGPLMARHQDPLLANQVQDEMVSSSIMLDIAAHLGAMDTRLNREEDDGILPRDGPAEQAGPRAEPGSPSAQDSMEAADQETNDPVLKIRRASEVALNAVMEGNDMPGRGSHAGEVQETNDLRHVAVFDEPQEGGLHGFEVVEASSGAERNDTSEAPVGGSGGGADGGGDEEKLEDEMVHASGSNEGNRPGGVPLAINEVDSASKNGRETTGTAEAGAEEEIRSPGEEGKGSTKGGKGMQHEDGEKTDEVRDKGSQAADHIMAVVEREEAEAVEVHQQPKESAAEERRMEDERTKKGEKDGSGNGSGEELSEAMDEEDDIEEMEARRANHKARTGSRPKGHPFPSVITRGRLRDLIEAQQRGGLVAADPSARKRHRGGGSIGGDAPHKIRLVSSGGGSGEKKRIGAKQQQPAQHRPRSTQPGEPDPDEEDAGAATKRPVYLYQDEEDLTEQEKLERKASAERQKQLEIQRQRNQRSIQKRKEERLAAARIREAEKRRAESAQQAFEFIS